MGDHISCNDVVELVTGYLERALSPDQASLFEQHVGFCDGCERYLDQMRVTIAAVGRIGEDELAPAARDRLRAAFREWRHA